MSLDSIASTTPSLTETTAPARGPESDRNPPRPGHPRRAPKSPGARIWAAIWPKLTAVGISIGIWQAVVWSEWKPPTRLPPPSDVFVELWGSVQTARFWDMVQVTMQRGILGFLIALVIGSLLGIAVSQWRVLRMAVGSLITGLQTMPSIAWFPFAILLFGLTESAIFFVIILGAAPSIANGIISGIDDTPPQLLRAGRMLGARGLQRYRYVILPAALPSYLAGLKQGWAFAWRSLMAGELLVPIAEKAALGLELSNARQFLDAPRLVATMLVILVIGMLVDSVFSWMTNFVRRRRGLTGLHSVPN